MEENAQLQGFVIARVLAEEWEIENIVVADSAAAAWAGHSSAGRTSRSGPSQGAAAVFLEVRESNRAARALYEKWAFLESGSRRGYYKDPQEDAILYRLDLV